MKIGSRFAAFAAALTMFAGAAAAQFDVNGPNASMTMQGSAPSAQDPIGHNVNVAVPGIFNITIDSGANPLSGIIMLAALTDADGINHLSVPWGGFVDCGNGAIPNVILVADGIGFSVNPSVDAFYRTTAPTPLAPASTFTQAFTASQFICNTNSAWQAIVQDPSNFPLPLDNTECGDAFFTAGQQFILLTGDDGTVTLPFLPGNTFEFHGVGYTDIWVNGNGYLNFGGFTSVNASGFTVDIVSWMTAQPSIAPCQTDWGIGNTGANDGIYYSEVGNQVLISWGDTRAITSGAPGMAHFADVDTNNQLDVTLDMTIDTNVNPCASPAAAPGTFTLSYPRFDTTTTTRPGDGAMGHTPGGAALVGLQTSSDIQGNGVTFTVAGQAALEEHNATGGNASTVGWDGLGAQRSFNEFRSWQGNSVTFTPNPGVIPGDNGYIGITANAPTDIVATISTASFSVAGGTSITASGKFFGFNPGGTISVTDSGANTALATGITINSGTGPLFTNEELVFTTPASIATGPGTVTFNYGSGYTKTFNVFISSPCQIVGSPQTQGDDSVITAALTVPVTMYGTAYTTMYMASNGTIDFGGANFSLFETLADFFNGHALGSNPGVAYLWCDLNPGGTGVWTVIEDTCAGTVSVNVTNQQFWNSNAFAGSNTVVFGSSGPDSVTLDYSGSIDDSGAFDTPVIGYTDGVTGIGSDTDFGANGGSATIIPGVYATGMFGSFAPDSIAEQFASNTYATTLQSINGGIINILNDGLGNLTIF